MNLAAVHNVKISYDLINPKKLNIHTSSTCNPKSNAFRHVTYLQALYFFTPSSWPLWTLRPKYAIISVRIDLPEASNKIPMHVVSLISTAMHLFRLLFFSHA